MRKFPSLLLVVTMACIALTAAAGEIIGNTFISEKDGATIEIPAEGWEIKNTEKAGEIQIAELTYRQVINGVQPTVNVNRMPNPNNRVKAETLLQNMRGNLERQGAEVGSPEARRIAGKPVLGINASMSPQGQKVYMVVYALSGENALYLVFLTVHSDAYEEGRRLFDELMEKVRY